MNAKERLLATLFETPGREHHNIKFCRGDSEEISSDELCAEANSAITQIETGIAETRESFGDKDSPKIDITDIL